MIKDCDFTIFFGGNMQLKHAVISFWFKELEFNPISKVNELENSLTGYFKAPFLINKKEPFINISIPRIIASSSDNHGLFNMSLINMNFDIRYNNENNDLDMAILYINEKLQLLYDVLKDIYDVEILYSSIKVEFVEKIVNSLEIHNELLKNNDSNIEDFMLKRGICKDDKYYVNEVISTSKEINFDIKLPKNVQPNEGDMLGRSMLISLKNAKIGQDVKNLMLEINDRLSYNNDPLYRVNKDTLRDLLYEFKLLVNKKIKD